MVSEDKVAFLQKWWVKAGIVFLMAALAEISQFFGLNILGRTFDTINIIVYAAGVLIAFLVDWLFSIVFNFWKTEMKGI